MGNIAIVCAMQKELDLIRTLSADNIHCRLSGIGKVNAALTANDLIEDTNPDYVLSIGVAGTFARGLEEGDVVIAERVAYHDVWCGEGNVPGQVDGCPKFFECDPSLVEKAARAIPDAKAGLVISGDQFYISLEEDMRQKAMYPDALAVDMESAAVAQTCLRHGVPFLAVKVISDTHLDGRQAEHYDDFWSSMAAKSFSALSRFLGESIP